MKRALFLVTVGLTLLISSGLAKAILPDRICAGDPVPEEVLAIHPALRHELDAAGNYAPPAPDWCYVLDPSTGVYSVQRMPVTEAMRAMISLLEAVDRRQIDVVRELLADPRISATNVRMAIRISRYRNQDEEIGEGAPIVEIERMLQAALEQREAEEDRQREDIRRTEGQQGFDGDQFVGEWDLDYIPPLPPLVLQAALEQREAEEDEFWTPLTPVEVSANGQRLRQAIIDRRIDVVRELLMDPLLSTTDVASAHHQSWYADPAEHANEAAPIHEIERVLEAELIRRLAEGRPDYGLDVLPPAGVDVPTIPAPAVGAFEQPPEGHPFWDPHALPVPARAEFLKQYFPLKPAEDMEERMSEEELDRLDELELGNCGLCVGPFVENDRFRFSLHSPYDHADMHLGCAAEYLYNNWRTLTCPICSAALARDEVVARLREQGDRMLQEQAATAIQKTWRGHQGRQQYREQLRQRERVARRAIIDAPPPSDVQGQLE